MQRTNTYLLAVILLLGISAKSAAQSNLIINGDFETQYPGKAPSQRYNILRSGSYFPVDELPSWHSLGLQSQADYLATNAIASESNPQAGAYGFNTHSGRGCVGIEREPHSYSHDQFIAQQINVVSGHTYRASFYARWRTPTNDAQKLGIFITNSEPSYDYTILPTPYASIVSAQISNSSEWTQVVGTFVAQASTSYIVVGYNHSQDVTPNSHIASIDYYAIDDVSLVEISPCDFIPNHYRPINFCSNQTDRPFGIRIPPPGFTFFWEFFRLNPTTGAFAPYRPRGLARSTSTSANPVLLVQGSQFPAGYRYTYRVRGQNDATGCYTEWSDSSEANGAPFTPEEDCPYGPGDNDPGVISGDPNPTSLHTNSATEQSFTTAYPNPASEMVTVPTGISDATLLDSKGNGVQRLNDAGNLDVRNLPNGLYNLQMRHNGKLINQRVQIVH